MTDTVKEQEYKVIAPDGKEHIVIGPAGATDEEITAQAQRLFGPKAEEEYAMDPSIPTVVGAGIGGLKGFREYPESVIGKFLDERLQRSGFGKQRGQDVSNWAQGQYDSPYLGGKSMESEAAKQKYFSGRTKPDEAKKAMRHGNLSIHNQPAEPTFAESIARGVKQVPSKTVDFLAHTLPTNIVSGAGAGYNFAQGVNRASEDKYGQAGLDFLGSLAGLLGLASKNPKAKLAGSAISGGAAATDYLLNREKSKEDEFAEGGSVPHFVVGGSTTTKLAKSGLEALEKALLPPAENAARTQIIGTIPTYQKAADIFKQQGATGRGLDFGAGLGEGAKVLGKNFDTHEPFAQNWTPTYKNAADIPSDAYGQLTNLNVLNVVPKEIRDQLVLDMGRVMEPGGHGIITTRGKDVMNAKGIAGPEPLSIITSRDTYQKGFTKDELLDYMRYMLGDKFDVNKLNLGPAGVLLRKK